MFPRASVSTTTCSATTFTPHDLVAATRPTLSIVARAVDSSHKSSDVATRAARPQPLGEKRVSSPGGTDFNHAPVTCHEVPGVRRSRAMYGLGETPAERMRPAIRSDSCMALLRQRRVESLISSCSAGVICLRGRMSRTVRVSVSTRGLISQTRTVPSSDADRRLSVGPANDSALTWRVCPLNTKISAPDSGFRHTNGHVSTGGGDQCVIGAERRRRDHAAMPAQMRNKVSVR